MSADLLWGLVRKNNAFVVKARNHGGVVFSSEPGNLLNIHNFKYSGLANSKTWDVKAGARGVVVSTKSGASRKPKSATRSLNLTRDVRRAARSVAASVAGNKYRRDLKAAVLARISAVYRSHKQIKAGVKKAKVPRRGRK
jgi:large subunit ribosomal protein L28e